MLELAEFFVDGELPSGWPPSIFCVRAPGSVEAVGSVTAGNFPAGALDRPSFLRRLLGHRTPRTVRMSVVHARNDGGIVAMLQHLDPVFNEVNRVYDSGGMLAGRCISFSKSTLRAGFRVEYADGRPFGEVPFARPAEGRRRLLGARSGREVGSIHRLSGEPTASGPPVRYAVSVGDGVDEEPAGRLFLLASAMTLALADYRLMRMLSPA